MSDGGDDGSKREGSALTENERKLIASLASAAKRHHQTIGTKANLEQSISEVVAGAVARADPADQNRLAETLTPAIVRCVRQEIRNSRHELVESLYPMMGRLISAYAANASRELVYRVDRRLESVLTGRYLRLRVKSWIEGVPYKELALREALGLKVHDLLLINRRTGGCLDRWHADADQAMGGDKDRLFAGMLSAIAEFSREALNDEKGELREVNFGSSRVLVRVTPSFLVVARCFGKGGRKVEARLDRVLRSFLETHAKALQNALETAPRESLHLLPELAETLNVELQPRPGEYGYRERGPVFAVGVAALCIILGLGSVGNHFMQRAQAAEIEQTVQQVVRQHEIFLAFPIQVDASPGGDKVVLTGTAPTPEAIENLVNAVRAVLGSTIKVVSNIVLAPVSETLSYTVESVSRLTRSLGDIQNALTTQLISPTQAVLTGPLGDALASRLQSGTVLSGAVWHDLSGELSSLATALERLPDAADRGHTAIAQGQIERVLDLLASRRRQIGKLLERRAATASILQTAGDSIFDDHLVASRNREVLQEVNRNVRRLTTALRSVVNPQLRAGRTGRGNRATVLNADHTATSAAPALSEYSALFEKGIDWKSVQLPQSSIADSLNAIAAGIRPGGTSESRADGNLPVRFRPIVVMPGVGRLDLTHSLGTVAGGAVEGTTGLVGSTTGAAGNTVTGIGQRTGGVVGGINEGAGAAVTGVTEGAGNTVEGVGTTVDNVGQGVGGTLENTLQGLGGKKE
ncbi:MAG: BON domain-containing protein [Dichotomicrobium sp.]